MVDGKEKKLADGASPDVVVRSEKMARECVEIQATKKYGAEKT